MNTKGFIISITAGFAVMLLLIGGTGTYSILFNAGYAQTVTGSQNQATEKSLYAEYLYVFTGSS